MTLNISNNGTDVTNKYLGFYRIYYSSSYLEYHFNSLKQDYYIKTIIQIAFYGLKFPNIYICMY